MIQEIIITAEEMYYLGGLMEAQYIDYAYIASMGDIQKEYAVYESTAKNGLSQKGILEEDFSGNINITGSVSELLRPVFFGSFESNLEVFQLGTKPKQHSFRYHVLGEDMTKVSVENSAWRVQSCTSEEILHDWEQCIPFESEKTAQTEFHQEHVTNIFVLKHVQIGQDSVVKIFFDCDGQLFSENEKEEIIPVPREAALRIAKEILFHQKEEAYGVL